MPLENRNGGWWLRAGPLQPLPLLGPGHVEIRVFLFKALLWRVK